MSLKTAYLICTTVRSGSSLLCEILRGSGLAGCPDEYFYEPSYPRFYEKYGVRTLAEYLPKVIEGTATENGVFGAKVMASYFFHQLLPQLQELTAYRQSSMPAAEILRDVFGDLRYIWLTRRDKVRQAISHVRAAQTNIWHSFELGRDSEGRPEGTYSYEGISAAILSDAAWNAEWQRFFASSGIKPLCLVYEDFIQDWDATARVVLAHLSVATPGDWKPGPIPAGRRLSGSESDAWHERFLAESQGAWNRHLAAGAPPPSGPTQDRSGDDAAKGSAPAAPREMPTTGGGPDDLPALVREAWAVGRKIDLSGIGYGRVHWGNQKDVVTAPFPYYYFLAGLVRVTGAKRILEIGTHSGGSIRAMRRGLSTSEGAVLVTVDVSDASDPYLKDETLITKLQGDAISQPMLRRILQRFGGGPCDLLFVDATHDFWPTLQNVALYVLALRPRLVIMDDITLNSEMQNLWDFLRESLPAGQALDAAAVEPAIRAAGATQPGFGVFRPAGAHVAPSGASADARAHGASSPTQGVTDPRDGTTQ